MNGFGAIGLERSQDLFLRGPFIGGTLRRASRLLMAGLLSLPPAAPLLGSLAAPFLAPAARAQGGQPLLPPSLPSNLPMTLPGGMPLPNLAGGAQQEILQRILDAAGGRTMAPPQPTPAPSYAAPYYQPAPAQPQASPFRTDLAEPLSNTEAFFANLLPEN